MDRVPDEAHLRELARTLLASSREGVIHASITYFARVLKRPELAPAYQNAEGGSRWVNRDASLAALRAHYGLAQD